MRDVTAALALTVALATAPAAARAFTLDSPSMAHDAAERLVAMFRSSCVAYVNNPSGLRADAVRKFGHREVLASTVFPWEGPIGGRATPRAALGSTNKLSPHLLIEQDASSNDKSCELFWSPPQAQIGIGTLLQTVETAFDIKLTRLSMDGAPPNIRNNRHGCAETSLSGTQVKICAHEWRNELQFTLSVTPATPTG
jgi:hypothetical protein